jgi:hypothetical protein
LPTIHRAHGLRFVIFTDDHEPAHVHAIGADGEAKIALVGDGPALVWARGLSNPDVRRAMAEAARLRGAWIEIWTAIHGGRG